jgi:cytochrome c oxidase subunit 2
MFAAMDTPPILPPQASEFAYNDATAYDFVMSYDTLFWYMMAVTTLGGLAVYALLTYCCFRFAKSDTNTRPQRILGSNKLEVIWTVIPLLFFLSFFVYGARVWDKAISIPKEAAEREYFVAGKQWMWKVQDPDGRRQINEITLCEGVPVKVTGTSEDVIHDFGIPAFRSKFDVVPGRYTAAWYKPTKVGDYHLFCDQYCGMGHSQMVGKVHVLSPDDFQLWKSGQYKATDKVAQTQRTWVGGAMPKGPLDGSPAWQGMILFRKLQCNGCHFTQSPDDPTPPKAPTLENIYGTRRELNDGRTIEADDAYISNAIRNPALHVRSGWKPIMPAYHSGLATVTDIYNLTAYIKSLRPGDLPNRVERTPTPIGGAPKASQGDPNKPEPKKEEGK